MHEDLNRVREKPYVNIDVSDGSQDIVASEENWKAYLERN
jgi:hypothetical protein